MGRLLILTLFLALVSFGSGCSEDRPADQEQKINKRSMNISRFVYRDDNRNGRYDMTDRPYAGQPLILMAPGGEQTRTVSNLSGFTNFKMSLNNPAHPIREAGRYKLRATPLEGMIYTSADHDIEVEFEQQDGSPGGLVASQTMQPFGVAPALTISGSISADNNAADHDWSGIAIGPDGTAQQIALDDAGNFQVPVTPGRWQLTVAGNSKERTRLLDVDTSAVRLSTIAFESSKPEVIRHHADQLTPIDFEQLTSSDTLFEIPNGYGGLDWHNWIATHHKYYQGAGYINSTTSGEFIAYNSSGHPATVSSTNPFDLVSVQIGLAWPPAEAGTVIVSAWRGETLAYRDEFRASTRYSTLFRADYRAITKVEFRTSQYWQLIIDDFLYLKSP